MPETSGLMRQTHDDTTLALRRGYLKIVSEDR